MLPYEDKRTVACADPLGVRWHEGAWRFALTTDFKPGVATGTWTFSAMLWPFGRDSVSDDWAVLGRVAYSVGVPEGQREKNFTVDTHPNAPHVWTWQEPVGRP